MSIDALMHGKPVVITAFDAQFSRELLQGLATFAVADKQQTGVFDFGKRAQQNVETLEVAEPPNGEDSKFSGRPVRDRRAEG